MSVKAKIAAGTATFGLVGGGLAMAGTMTASAATPNCGYTCTQIFTQKYGPQYLVDVFQARAAATQPGHPLPAVEQRPGRGLRGQDLGTVGNFYTDLRPGHPGSSHTLTAATRPTRSSTSRTA